MAKLTTKQLKKLRKSQFADRENRKFPIDTEDRARNALSRVSQSENRKTVSKAKADEIRKRARAALKRFKRK